MSNQPSQAQAAQHLKNELRIAVLNNELTTEQAIKQAQESGLFSSALAMMELMQAVTKMSCKTIEEFFVVDMSIEDVVIDIEQATHEVLYLSENSEKVTADTIKALTVLRRLRDLFLKLAEENDEEVVMRPAW